MPLELNYDLEIFSISECVSHINAKKLCKPLKILIMRGKSNQFLDRIYFGGELVLECMCRKVVLYNEAQQDGTQERTSTYGKCHSILLVLVGWSTGMHTALIVKEKGACLFTGSMCQVL